MSLLSSSPSLLSVILGFISGDEREDKVRILAKNDSPEKIVVDRVTANHSLSSTFIRFS